MSDDALLYQAITANTTFGGPEPVVDWGAALADFLDGRVLVSRNDARAAALLIDADGYEAHELVARLRAAGGLDG